MNNNDTEQELMIGCSICDKQFREPKEKDLAIFKWSTDEHSTVSYSFCKPCAEMVGDIVEAIASRRRTTRSRGEPILGPACGVVYLC